MSWAGSCTASASSDRRRLCSSTGARCPSRATTTSRPSELRPRRPPSGSRRCSTARSRSPRSRASRASRRSGARTVRRPSRVEVTHRLRRAVSYEPVDRVPSFPKLEERVLERWRERDVFHESLRRREGNDVFVFYEGPPTANGRPGAHHVLSRVFKDVFPRYKTMRGHYVPRKAGWDCHGLPVELEIERELGIQSKEDIEKYGVADFNQRCRESVLAYVDDWNRLTERIAFWIDTDDAYLTLDNEYIESVWWSLAEVWKRGLLYQGHKVVPYCPRCGTALSSHEVALGYQDVVDPSVFVRLPVRGPHGPVQSGDELLVWTTTP